MSPFNEIVVSKAAQLIGHAAPGAMILLFGSHARGDAGEESDFDFLVIEPEVGSSREEMIRLRDVLRPLGVPVDILVASRKTFDHWRDTPGTIYFEASREGRILDAIA